MSPDALAPGGLARLEIAATISGFGTDGSRPCALLVIISGLISMTTMIQLWSLLGIGLISRLCFAYISCMVALWMAFFQAPFPIGDHGHDDQDHESRQDPEVGDGERTEDKHDHQDDQQKE